jgi:hypothetical protein
MIRKYIIVLVFLFSSVIVLADDNPCFNSSDPCYPICNANCGSFECEECIAGTQVPLDGGLIWLVIGGAGLGVRNLIRRKKKKD